MKILEASKIKFQGQNIEKCYLGRDLVYSWVSIPPKVSEETISNSATAESYDEGSTNWGDIVLSSGCSLSEDGLEIQNEETYISSMIDTVTYPFTFEFKGRVDSSSYRNQANNPGMLFGLGPTRNGWGDGITCYSTTDYGIIIDTTGAMKIVTNKTPEYVHIVLTVDSSGTMKMYMNGVGNTWTASSDSAITSSKSYIFNGQGVGRFVGAISILRIWNSLLSDEEINKLFKDDDSKYSL